MRAAYEGHTFKCRTKFDINDIVYMRTKNYVGQMVKEGPIRIIGIELRVDSKGNLTTWYNCESANFYKFAFHAKGSKHYVKEKDLYLESEVDEMGWDVESKGYTDWYKPDGTEKTNEEYWEDQLAERRARGEKVKLLKTAHSCGIVPEDWEDDESPYSPKNITKTILRSSN